MLDIGWSEMAVIALLALIVLGPKELPNAMRTAAKWAKKARSLAREFQSGVDDMIREADLEDARKALKQTKSLDLDKLAENTIDPDGGVKAELRDLDKTAKASGSPEAAPEDTASKSAVGGGGSPGKDAEDGKAKTAEADKGASQSAASSASDAAPAAESPASKNATAENPAASSSSANDPAVDNRAKA